MSHTSSRQSSSKSTLLSNAGTVQRERARDEEQAHVVRPMRGIALVRLFVSLSLIYHNVPLNA